MAVITTGGKAAKGVNYVDYIETTGTQWFDTGCKPNQNTRIVLDAQFVNATSQSVLYVPFGTRGNGLFFELYKASTNNWNLTFLWNTTYTQYFTIDYAARHVFAINKNVASVDSDTRTYTNASFQTAYSMYLCATNNTGSAESVTALRIWSCQIYDNGSLIRDYRPCYDPEGVVCLYDEVSGSYCYSRGSGNCIAGVTA